MKTCAAPNDSEFLSQRITCEEEQKGEIRREPYQRDRDRIVHSRAFRRLMHKTQVFNANYGDHFRNRLTHSLEVSQIARSIGKALELNDELVEAIALGHDLGHTPFGHVGERTIHGIISGHIPLHDFKGINQGFKHNFQGLEVVDRIESSWSNKYGLNLTLAVRDGILKHTDRKIKWNGILEEARYDLDLRNIILTAPSMTLEGQVVAIADEIAQCTHDLEDAYRAKIITRDDLAGFELVQHIADSRAIDISKLSNAVDVRNYIIRAMVDFLIHDVYSATKEMFETTYKDGKNPPTFLSEKDVFVEQIVGYTKSTKAMVDKYRKMKNNLVIASQAISQSDAKAEYMIKQMFKAYYSHPKQLPDEAIKRYCAYSGKVYNRLALNDDELRSDSVFIRLVCDHIACMTDQYAEREYTRLYLPDYN